jgi:exopolysaccharide biosynthesis protein
VRDGRPAAAADPGIYGPGFADARHPRTAVGVRADGRILLVTVDGRQPELSVGMTIAELATLLIELGAVEAVNMDGGGSTTMVVRGRVVNSPSDLTGERAVGDALLIYLR